MNDSIKTKSILVDIQENGIIRNAETGYLIGRLTDKVPFNSEHIQDKSAIECSMAILRKAFNDDDSYAHAWHCNIACVCKDAILAQAANRVSFHDMHIAGNDAASRFMKLCFDVETSNDMLNDSPKSNPHTAPGNEAK